MPEPLYFEDLLVGQRFRAGPIEVTPEAIKAFAAQFDPQPFHLDESAALDSLFGGLVASGWHTAAATMRLLTQSLPIAGGVIGTGGRIEWPRPVRPGDRLGVETEILALSASRSRPERGIAKIRTTTSNQNGEAVQLLNANIVVFLRPFA
jgi:acyl dehydratase